MVEMDGEADLVSVTLASRRSVSCPGVEGADNLAWRALDALERAVGSPLPLAVEIDKRLPARAGLGGGSSDAASTLVAANRLLGLGLDAPALERIAAEVGSDVSFFVGGGVRWAEGRGDVVTPARAPSFSALVAVPAFGLSTAAVYRGFDRLPPPPPAPAAPVPAEFAGLAGWARNDLWPAALALAPRLGAIARGLAALGSAPVLLCGSGAAVAGLFPDASTARAAADRAAAASPPLAARLLLLSHRGDGAGRAH
jgi:4-diphosphocytidyl-2-C-methyl-D-erythritol kinase